MLNDIKTALRISHTALDNEITDLIEAARHELMLSGVTSEKANNDMDPLIKRAIITYVKANFGWDNPDSTKLNHSFESLKMHLSLSQEYNAYTLTFTVTDDTNPLENAIITFNDEDKITNSTGNAVFLGVRESQNMIYCIKLDGYESIEGTVDVEGSITIAITMTAVV